MTNEDLHELAGAYALDALGEEERRAFEEHLAGCERCRGEVAGLSETAATLAYGVDEGPAPPAELRDRILVAAREEPPTVVALRPRRTRLYVGTAVAVAACAALAIGLWAGLSGGGSSPRIALSQSPSGAELASVSGLDAAPAGKVYVLWVIAGGTPRPAGSLAGGGGKTVVTLSRAVPKGATVAITLERSPDVTAPTPPILVQTTESV